MNTDKPEDVLERKQTIAAMYACTLPLVAAPPGYEWLPPDLFMHDENGLSRLLVPLGGPEKAFANSSPFATIAIATTMLFDNSWNQIAEDCIKAQNAACETVVARNVGVEIKVPDRIKRKDNT